MSSTIIENKKNFSSTIGEGNEMAQWVIKANGNVVPDCTMCSLHADELYNQQEIKKRETFDTLIERRWRSLWLPSPVSQLKQSEDETWDEYYDQNESPQYILKVEDVIDIEEKLLCQQPACDKIINAKVLLQIGDKVQSTRVLQ